jgi:hypothetical protein
MKKLIYYLLIIFFTVFLFSCKINVSDGDNKENENEEFLHNPQPSDGAMNVSLTPTLNWIYNANGILNFEVYLDTLNPPLNMITQTSSNHYNITDPLKSSKMYYWRIRTYYEGSTYESSIWKFTTTFNIIPIDGLIAYYPFNGNANDESSYGHHGQVFNANLTYDRFNNYNRAYNFSGVNSYIVVSHSTLLQPLDGLTVSAWVSMDTLNNCVILGKGVDSLPGWYSLLIDSVSQSLSFQINFSPYIGGQLTTVNSNMLPMINTWYSVIGTYNNNSMDIYLNGQLVNSLNNYLSLKSNYEPLIIGNSMNGKSFIGDIDDIRIYNRALNNSEIQQLYHEGEKNKITF